MAIMCVAQYLLNEYVPSRQVEYRQWVELISSCNFLSQGTGGVHKVTKGGRL